MNILGITLRFMIVSTINGVILLTSGKIMIDYYNGIESVWMGYVPWIMILVIIAQTIALVWARDKGKAHFHQQEINIIPLGEEATCAKYNPRQHFVNDPTPGGPAIGRTCDYCNRGYFPYPKQHWQTHDTSRYCSAHCERSDH